MASGTRSRHGDAPNSVRTGLIGPWMSWYFLGLTNGPYLAADAATYPEECGGVAESGHKRDSRLQ
jgi:hypothetical protein